VLNPRRRLPVPRVVLWLVLVGLLPGTLCAQAPPDPAETLEIAIATAETSLQRGEPQAAEAHYREALFEGWLLMGSLERLQRRPSEARAALAKATLFQVEDAQALEALASAHLQLGQATKAVEILRPLVQRDPKNTSARRLLAKALAASGQGDLAVQELNAASASLPDDPEAVFLLATEYLWLKKVDTAEQLYAEIVKARPIPQTHILIGRAYRDAGEYQRARAELEAALAQDPNVRRAHYYLGMVILGDPAAGPTRLEKAILEFQEELRLAPRDALANDQLGTALLEAGRPAEALLAFENAVSAEPRSLYLQHLARCQLALDRPAEAATSAQRALELAEQQGASDAELEKIHYTLGLAQKKLGQAQQAADHLAQAKRYSGHGAEPASGSPAARTSAAGTSPTPERDPAIRDEPSPLAGLAAAEQAELRRRVTAGLARAYFNLGVLQAQNQRVPRASERFARAAAFFEQAAQVDPDFPQVQASLGVAHFNARQFDQAVAPLTLALAANPKDAGLKRMLATSCVNTEDWPRAASLLQDDPERQTDASLQFAYGLSLLRSHHGAEAEAVLAALISRQGESAELRVLLGQAQAEQKKYGPATASIEQALALKANVPGAQGTLGMIYLRQAKVAEAEQALRAELALHPSDLMALQNLALVLDAEQRPQDAIPLLREVLRQRPDRTEARALLARLLLKSGSAREAVEQLETALRQTPTDSSLHDLLGQAYQQLGRTELAQQEFAAARKAKTGR
jgi:tetratricopeptide (TPR) repeat protein